MHRLKEAVREDATRPIKRAFDAVVRGRHQQGGGDREPLPEFHSVRTLMQRARSTVVPPIPQVCADVRIEGEWANTWLQERFLLYLDNDWGVAVFATDENMQRLQRCHDVYINGTFRTCPSPYTQFFTIHGNSSLPTWVQIFVLTAFRKRQCQPLSVAAAGNPHQPNTFSVVDRLSGRSYRPANPKLFSQE
ncbi:hypothetical protein PoB_006639800 [Plakobranchus ocellatus]|uniref:Uncharacterized protein n=1 Tax=Plakobranchus ocellatus TaxID=259542 RepID=A0AAV4D756_9GAST|nr:hypothetical protein PoB_006639800 [Plakobranchus ocellatus]